MAADTSMGARVYRIAFAVFACGLIVLTACDTTESAYSDPLQCPNHTVGLPGGDTILPIAGAVTAIAEFHDCQRLIDPGNPDMYSTLAGIWVHERLNQLVDSLHKLNMWMDTADGADSAHGADSAYGADSAHGADSAENGQQPVATGTGITFAIIYAWEGPYEPLSIQQGWNCLRVFPSTAYPGSPRYAAQMFPVTDASQCEPLGAPDDRGARPMAVHDYTTAGFGNADYPPVGRWEWDNRNRHNYISLKCGAAWCDVTPLESYGKSRVYKVPTGEPRNNRRVWEIKGWYDEQHLAIADSGKPGRMKPARIAGTVVPDPAIDTLNQVEQFNSVWIPAAEIGMHGRLAVYETKLNLDPGVYPGVSQGGRLNRLFLCRDIGEGCPGVPADLLCEPSGAGESWYARVEPSGPGTATGTREPAHYCIIRHDHSGLNRHIPGTARWWWVAEDEKLWIKCAEGCCTVR